MFMHSRISDGEVKNEKKRISPLVNSTTSSGLADTEVKKTSVGGGKSYIYINANLEKQQF